MLEMRVKIVLVYFLPLEMSENRRVNLFSVLLFGCFPGVWFLLADVSEHSVCSIFKADDLEVM
jgi:hypothetical protein